MLRLSSFLVLVLVLTSGCGDDTTAKPADAGPADGSADAASDAGPPQTIEDLPVEQQTTLSGLGDKVDAVQDERGMWHVYAKNDQDAVRVVGYLMARDRIGQMYFFRLGAEGRTAEFAGSLEPNLVQDDIETRFVGTWREAKDIWDHTLPDSEKTLLQAYADGVNAYIAQLKDGSASLPRGVDEVLDPAEIDDWTPVDTLAIARYMSASLAYDGANDLNMTNALMGWQAAFPASSSDPRLAARANGFHDMWAFKPLRDTFVIDGFPNVGTDTGSRALRLPHGQSRARSLAAALRPHRAQILAAKRFMDGIEKGFEARIGDAFRGSNSWAVSGSLTADGNPLLCNDPHLSLTSPPLFWYMHVDTKRAGGDLDTEGQGIVGTPLVLLGFNQDLAWGLTTTGYDVTDVYLEQITPGTGGGPDTVLFNGTQMPIQTIHETITLDTGGTMDVPFEVLPNHATIIPGTRTATSAIAIRWTGFEPSDELGAVYNLNKASSIDEARTALHGFGVHDQCVVMASRDGHIFYTSHARVPTRDPRAMTYDPMTFMGYSPAFVLPGTGEYEWTGDMSDRYIPHVLDPAQGFVVTANADEVGVTQDGNPFNDAQYIGWDFTGGNRAYRITERLTQLKTRGAITPDDMKSVQADAQSPYGRFMRDALVAELDRAETEMTTPGTYPDLTAAVTAAGSDKMTKILAMRDKLKDWSFDTPAAVEGSPTADQVNDSIATTIFMAAIGRLQKLAFGDELAAVGETGSNTARKTLVWALTQPETLRTYDATIGDTVLWDDITTPTVETRGDRVVRAFTAALDWLEANMGADMSGWLWGKVHTLTLESIVPQLVDDVLSIPPAGDATYPNGFPRHGENDTVDPGSFGYSATTNFTYGSGPQQRLVVDMTPDGPKAWSALPGGESGDPDSPHHADEIEHWRHNEAPPLHFTEADVVANAERRLQFMP